MANRNAGALHLQQQSSVFFMTPFRAAQVTEFDVQDQLNSLLMAQVTIEELGHHVECLSRFWHIRVIEETMKHPFPDVQLSIDAELD